MDARAFDFTQSPVIFFANAGTGLGYVTFKQQNRKIIKSKQPLSTHTR
jgi:hypothetical protein